VVGRIGHEREREKGCMEGADDVDNGHESSSDEEERKCPLCEMDDIELEHLNNSRVTPHPLRVIMAREILYHGQKRSKSIYRKMCKQYNNEVLRPMLESGVKCEPWTVDMVRAHFEKHVTLLPRRILGDQIEMLVKLSMANWAEIQASALGMGGQEPLDPKSIAKAKDLAMIIAKLVSEHRTYVKEDLASTGIDTIWRNADTDGNAHAVEMKKLIDKTVLIQSSAGAGDRPLATELFEQ
jgi:hypothetical protein